MGAGGGLAIDLTARGERDGMGASREDIGGEVLGLLSCLADSIFRFPLVSVYSAVTTFEDLSSEMAPLRERTGEGIFCFTLLCFSSSLRRILLPCSSKEATLPSTAVTERGGFSGIN